MAKRKPPRKTAQQSRPDPVPTPPPTPADEQIPVFHDNEPQPFLEGREPWRELQPEYEDDRDRYMEAQRTHKRELAMMITRVMGAGDGPKLLDLMEKMIRAHPRGTYDEVLRRDGKQEIVDWLRQMMDYLKES